MDPDVVFRVRPKVRKVTLHARTTEDGPVLALFTLIEYSLEGPLWVSWRTGTGSFEPQHASCEYYCRTFLVDTWFWMPGQIIHLQAFLRVAVSALVGSAFSF